MTEKDIYSNGVALLEEWEDVNYCEHSFKFKDEWLTDKEVVDLLNELDEKYVNEFSLRETLQQELQRSEEENNQLKKENKELRQDNDIKFWKHQFIMEYNASKIMMHEISRAVDGGYEISEEFQKYLNELRVQNDKNKEKMERLRI